MSNGGVLELMMRYLKAVGRRFLEEWPRGLPAVVLEVHQAWRRHSMGLPNPLLRDSNDQHLRVTRKTSWIDLVKTVIAIRTTALFLLVMSNIDLLLISNTVSLLMSDTDINRV